MIKRLLAILLILTACEEEAEVLLDFSSYEIMKVSDSVKDVVIGNISDTPIVVQVVNAQGEPQASVPIAWSLYFNETEPIAELSVFTEEYDESVLLADLTTDNNGFAKCYVRGPWISFNSGTGEPVDVYLSAKITGAQKELESQEPVEFAFRILDESHTYKAVKTDGDNQTGKILLVSEFPIEFELEDSDGFGVYNYDFLVQSESPGWGLFTTDPVVEFSGDAVAGFTGKTDGNGQASFYWLYGNQPGQQQLTVSIFTSSGDHVEGSPMVFTAEVADLEIFTTLERGDIQSAAATTGLATPLSVKLVDENNEPVSGYEIIWEVPDGHQIQKAFFWDDEVTELEAQKYSSRSNSEGLAEVRLVSGPTTGSFSATAHVLDGLGNEVNGSPVLFNYSTFEKGSFTDPRDNKTYETIEFNGKTWFTQNLNYQGGNGICFEENAAYCDEFGTMYTWNEALNVCPTGWHLASDQEWQDLELYLGMDPEDVDDFGSARTRVFDLGLMAGEWSGMNIIGGGYYSPDGGFIAGKYGSLNDWGYADGQWTSDEYNVEKAIWRVMGTGWYSTVGRYADNKDFKAYVRCVKD